MAYRRRVSKASLPLLVLASAGCLDLSELVREPRLETDSGGGKAEAEEGDCCSVAVESMSLPFPLSFDFCLAALTLALVRKGFGSDETADDEAWSM